MAAMHASPAPRGPMGHGGHGPMGHGARGAAGQHIDRGTWGKLLRYCRRFVPAVAVALVCAMVGHGAHAARSQHALRHHRCGAGRHRARYREARAGRRGRHGQYRGERRGDGAPAGRRDGRRRHNGGRGRRSCDAAGGDGHRCRHRFRRRGGRRTFRRDGRRPLDGRPREHVRRDARCATHRRRGRRRDYHQGHQQKLLDIFADLDMSDTEAAMAALDELPASVKGLVEPGIDMDLVARIALRSWAFTWRATCSRSCRAGS